jgi:putative restriction endonuclease
MTTISDDIGPVAAEGWRTCSPIRILLPALSHFVTDYSLMQRTGVIVTRRFATYKDQPGLLYHYPNLRYDEHVRGLQGCLVLCYEPRRGGTSAISAAGGRSAFVGYAVLGDRLVDPDDSSHSFVRLRGFCEFPTAVPISSTKVSGKSLEHAVHELPINVVEEILRMGFIVLASKSLEVREGLVDMNLPPGTIDRPIEQVVTNRFVRDATFRIRVVDQVYDGRCALTGVRMTNGHGRAEADAAHIRPVSEGGPDSVRNGIALMKSLHWAFDRGMVSLTDEGRILCVDRGLDEPICRLLREDGIALLPSNAADRPHPSFLTWHRQNRFKGSQNQSP